MEPLLRLYKSLLKTVARDASLRARRAPDIAGVLREIERWLAEARVAAVQMLAGEFASGLSSYRGRQPGEAAAAAVDNGDGDGDGEEEELEPREAWALDRLCDALLVRGALVPISRKSVINISPNFLIPCPLSLARRGEEKINLVRLTPFFFVLESEYRRRKTCTIRPRRSW